MRRRTGFGIAVVAVAAGVVLTPRLMPGHPVVAAVDRVVDSAVEAVFGVLGLDRSHTVTVVEVRGGDESRAASSDDPFRWAGALADGQVVEIRGVNGPVEAVPADGDRVVVTAEKSSRRSDPDEVRIVSVEHDAGMTFCAVYPTPSGERENVCAPGDGYRSSVRNNDVSVRFRVEVPAGVRLDVKTVNGDVEALRLVSDVSARTVNGDVEVTTRGFARASTVNGSISAAMGRWMPEGAEFETVNGSIELDLPDDVDADLDASWVNGGLDSDLPLLVDGRMGRRSVRGRLGDGGPDLDIKTVNGSIRIR